MDEVRSTTHLTVEAFDLALSQIPAHLDDASEHVSRAIFRTAQIPSESPQLGWLAAMTMDACLNVASTGRTKAIV